MAIEAVKIPQNVYVEDRIIGPITLKHLIILGIGAGISYVIFAGVTKAGYTDLPVKIMAWIPFVLSAAFAFLRINDLSLFNIILLLIESAHKPNVRYWSSSPGLSINIITRQSVHELEHAQAKATDTASKLVEMTRQLEKRQQELNRIAAHEDQRPEATEAVKTQMQDIIAEVPEGPTLASSSVPVQKSRISASSFDPALSLDTIAHDLPTFQTFVTTQY